MANGGMRCAEIAERATREEEGTFFRKALSKRVKRGGISVNGKEKCRILKGIRMEIARKNGIEYAVDECGHKGDCRGTCPRCEAELRYLEDQLARRQRFQKAVAVAGISIGMVAALSGCSAIDRLTDAFKGETGAALPTPTPAEEMLAGIMPPPTPTPNPDALLGEIAPSAADW